jgi:exosortase E/protease (VPEID-CTERM system)
VYREARRDLNLTNSTQGKYFRGVSSTDVDSEIGVWRLEDRRRLVRSEFYRLLPRWAGLLLLLGVELIWFSAPFDARPASLPGVGGPWPILVYPFHRPLITGLALILFLSWPVPLRKFLQVVTQSDIAPRGWFLWLVVHCLIAASMFAAEALWRTRILPARTEPELWLSLWRAMLVVNFGAWAAAALTPRFWLEWFRSSRAAFLAGGILAIAADVLGYSVEPLWWPLQNSTFRTVGFLLRLCGRIPVTSQHQLIIGTSSFTVEIWPVCSGLEGIALITIFVAAYLWLFRTELRFPSALLLLPVGAIASWFFNSVRITVLILIGSINPAVAMRGFHSVAGWLFFILVACGLVWASWSLRLFTKDLQYTGLRSSRADVYLLPLVATMTTELVTRSVSAGFDWLYPLEVIVTAGVFWMYCGELAELRWDVSVCAVALGICVSLIWIILSGPEVSTRLAYSESLRAMSRSEAAGWLFFRTAGSLITVPMAEELAFRGYLMRKLIASDFASVNPGQFTWLSFLVSSLAFGALHRQWLIGIIAGMLFAVAQYRRGYISDAVLAHSTANGVLSAYVLATGAWSLWS